MKSLYTDWPLLLEMFGKSSFFFDIFQQNLFLQDTVKKLVSAFISLTISHADR